jgi:hypothetical protein
VNRLIQVARAMPLEVGAALLASADGYTPRANSALDHAREELGTIAEIANALADNLPAPKLTARKSRRRRRKRRGQPQAEAPTAADGAAQASGEDASGDGRGEAVETSEQEPQADTPPAEDAA